MSPVDPGSEERPTVLRLAELDAGLVDSVEASPDAVARARRAAQADPGDAAVLAALAATRADLAALPRLHPPSPVRWTGAAVDEPVPTVVDSPRRRRSAMIAGALLAAAAAVVAAMVTAGPRPPTVTAVALAAAARDTLGMRDAGPLVDPRRRAACLAGSVAAPDAPLLGARPVVWEDRAGVLLVLGTGRLGTFAVAVVDPGCGDGGPGVLASRVVGPAS